MRIVGKGNNRAEFGSIAKFGSSINASVIKPLWDRFSVKMSGYNSFVMQNKGVFLADGSFDSAKLITSMGKLGATVIGDSIYEPTSNSVTLSWSPTPEGSYQLATDKAYIVIVDSAGVVLATRSGLDLRSSAAITFTVAENTKPAPVVHAYLAFAREDGSIVGDSTHKVITA